ncbi:MAG: DUF2017 domain-containing protein [Actinobacteria bacterium]|nr:DUF2017 domain-containing protein [Actinomycetota bacterium]
MRAFRATPDGYEAALEPFEREVLTRVVGDVLELLESTAPERPAVADDELPSWSVAATATRPLDTALARLLPDASTDDAELAAEFRRLTQDDLRATKSAGLRLLAGLLAAAPSDAGAARLLVARDQGGRVAAAFTDVRLVLADRLDLRTDEDAEALHSELAAPRARRGRADSRHALAELYEALTWWQESLLEVLAADLPEGPTA